MKKETKIKAIILSISDTRNEKTDLSGITLQSLLISMGAEVQEKILISDDFGGLRNTLYSLTEREDVNLIVTTGGTGFSERDNTPEATRAVIEKEAPGLAEAMRIETSKKTQTAILSRGICGIRNQTLIINLPGSPRAVKECFDIISPILQHAVNLLSGNTSH